MAMVYGTLCRKKRCSLLHDEAEEFRSKCVDSAPRVRRQVSLLPFRCLHFPSLREEVSALFMVGESRNCFSRCARTAASVSKSFPRLLLLQLQKKVQRYLFFISLSLSRQEESLLPLPLLRPFLCTLRRLRCLPVAKRRRRPVTRPQHHAALLPLATQTLPETRRTDLESDLHLPRLLQHFT